MRPQPRERAVFGPYFLLEQLAQGGMAQIWRARLASGAAERRELVVKTLLPRLVGQSLFADLFAAEARITKLLSHPGIVRLVGDGAVKRVPYLAMERVDGCDLGSLRRATGRLPVDIALSIGIEMCRAVGFAHDWRDEKGKPRPIVHGDLSPSNVMVRRDGGVTLLDFGVAHMSRRAARARAHLLIGKSGYFAPELLDDASADTRSDVFSAGVVLHELLTGRPLFKVDSERETLRRLTEEPIAPASRSNPEVTRGLDLILLRALQREPSQRFATANELAEALEWLRAPKRASRERVAAFVRRHSADGASVRTPGSARSVRGPRAAGVQSSPPPRRDAAAARRRPRPRTLRAAVAVAVLLAALLAPRPKLAPIAQHVLEQLDAALYAIEHIEPPAPPLNSSR